MIIKRPAIVEITMTSEQARDIKHLLCAIISDEQRTTGNLMARNSLLCDLGRPLVRDTINDLIDGLRMVDENIN